MMYNKHIEWLLLTSFIILVFYTTDVKSLRCHYCTNCNATNMQTGTCTVIITTSTLTTNSTVASSTTPSAPTNGTTSSPTTPSKATNGTTSSSTTPSTATNGTTALPTNPSTATNGTTLLPTTPSQVTNGTTALLTTPSTATNGTTSLPTTLSTATNGTTSLASEPTSSSTFNSHATENSIINLKQKLNDEYQVLRNKRASEIESIKENLLMQHNCDCENGICYCDKEGLISFADVSYVCVTDTQKVNGVNVVNKGCAVKLNSSSNTCQESGYSSNCRICEKDLCNQSVSLKLSTALLTSVFLLYFR